MNSTALTTPSLNVELGKTYVTNDGKQVTIYGDRAFFDKNTINNGTRFLASNGNAYGITGKIHGAAANHPSSLKEEYEEKVWVGVHNGATTSKAAFYYPSAEVCVAKTEGKRVPVEVKLSIAKALGLKPSDDFKA